MRNDKSFFWRWVKPDSTPKNLLFSADSYRVDADITKNSIRCATKALRRKVTQRLCEPSLPCGN